jgi:hypothetical protein
MGKTLRIEFVDPDENNRKVVWISDRSASEFLQVQDRQMFGITLNCK